jgi:hypothetical protein
LPAGLETLATSGGVGSPQQIAFRAFAQHESVVPRKLAGVVAGPKNQVIGLGDCGQFLGFFIDFYIDDDMIIYLKYNCVHSSLNGFDRHAHKPISC